MVGDDMYSWHNDKIKRLEARIAEVEAVVEALPLSYTNDGVPYVRVFADKRTFWCVFRHCEFDPWGVSPCHLADGSEEATCSFDWHVRDAEDECMVLGVWSTEAGAEAARAAEGADS